MITIEHLEVQVPFKYLWCKYVDDVNLDVHCAKSLKGTYSKKIDVNKKSYENIILDESDSKIIYICGVSAPYVWKNNFHLAIKYEKGSVVRLGRNGIDIKILNAKELPINFNYRECEHEKASINNYKFCRNWQFAYLYQDLFR